MLAFYRCISTHSVTINVTSLEQFNWFQTTYKLVLAMASYCLIDLDPLCVSDEFNQGMAHSGNVQVGHAGPLIRRPKVRIRIE